MGVTSALPLTFLLVLFYRLSVNSDSRAFDLKSLVCPRNWKKKYIYHLCDSSEEALKCCRENALDIPSVY